MLKDNIVKSFNIQKLDKDYMEFDFRGELDVKAYKDGQLFYHDGGDNTITTWAKHAMIHALTGDVYTPFGTLGNCIPYRVGDTNARYSNTQNHSSSSYYNVDGNCISNRQYWWDSADLATYSPPWSSPNSSDPAIATLLYNILPTKMLFGTGRESNLWANLSTNEQSTLTAQSWNQSLFDTGITATTGNNNYYSGTLTNVSTYGSFSGAGTITNSRTFIDPVTAKIVGTPDPGEFGVQGAIKDSVPTPGSVGGSITKANTGIGCPNFMYFQKDFTNKWASSSSEIYVSTNTGDNYEHKITYSLTMPSQTGTYSTWYYPFNGFTMKVAGLFSDSRLVMGNTTPSGISDPAYYPYTNMPGGILFAKRYITPIFKDAGTQITVQWTIFL